MASEMPHDEEGRVYDAMRVKARVVKFYGVSPSELDRMDYMEFFGLLREMRVYVEERQTPPSSSVSLDAWGDIEGEDYE